MDARLTEILTRGFTARRERRLQRRRRSGQGMYVPIAPAMPTCRATTLAYAGCEHCLQRDGDLR